jgi:pSer/pThr/pTyr-binding forkhead associated (FHA) protein
MWILETDESVTDRATFRVPSGGVATIGRATGAGFILDAPLVSRLHCRLSAGDEAIQVKDLDSTNGTFVNGRRIRSAKLHAGDRLKVGRVEIRISKTD